MAYETSSLSSLSSLGQRASLGSTNSFKPDGSQTSLAALFMAGGNSTHQPAATPPEEEFYPAPAPLSAENIAGNSTEDADLSPEEFLADSLPSPAGEQGTASSGLVSTDVNDVSPEAPNDNGSLERAPHTSPTEQQFWSKPPAFANIDELTDRTKTYLRGALNLIWDKKEIGEREIGYAASNLKNTIRDYPDSTFPLLNAITAKKSNALLTAFLAGLGKAPYRKQLQTYMTNLARTGNDKELTFLLANDKVRHALGRAGDSAETLDKRTFYHHLLTTAAKHNQSSTLSNLLSSKNITDHLPPSCYNELMSTLLNAAQPEPELVTTMLKSDVCQKNLTKETLADVTAYLLQNQPNNKEAYTAFIYCRRAHKLNSATIDTLLTLYTTTTDHNRNWSSWLLKQAWRSRIPPQTIGKLMVRFSSNNNKEALDMLLQFSTLRKIPDSDKRVIIANLVENNQEALLLAFHRKGQPSMNAYATSIKAIVTRKMDGLMKVIARHYRRQPFRSLFGSKQDELTIALAEVAKHNATNPDMVPSPAMIGYIETILPRKDRPVAWKSR